MQTKLSLIFTLSLWIATSLSLQAQAGTHSAADTQKSQQSQEEAPVINSVQIRYMGAATVSEEKIRANVALRSGQVLDPALTDRSLRNLNETGLFDLYYFEHNLRPDGKVDLTLVVQPRLLIRKVTFTGNKEYSASSIQKEQKLLSRENRPLSDFNIQNDIRLIQEFYRKKGYTDISVKYDVVKDENAGLGDVTFHIQEGARIGIRKIQFIGNEAIDSDDLEDVMETKTRGYLSWLTGTGRYKPEVLREDMNRLRDAFRNEGFLDVEIPEDQVELTYPKPDSMHITIHVKQGRRYATGKVSIEGNSVLPSEKLYDALSLREGDPFSPAKVDADREALIDLYGREGRLDTRVAPERVANLETGNIDLVYHIRESERFYLESINIEGNLKTKSKVILRELALAPGDVFDLVKMKVSRNRLRNLRFFDTVEMTPEPTQAANRRNLRIDVKEGRTGALTFGAGFSTLENIVVFAEVTQTNFDLFNYSSLFQGAGQKFRLRVALGSRSNEAILSFEEPWFLEQQLAVGFELYRTESRYMSSLYNELRMGFEVYVRKRLFELVEGRLSYRLEEVDIFDVADDAPSIYKREKGTRLISKVGFSLVRDTRNNFVEPSSGNRFEISTEYAGVGGDVDYFRLEGRAAQYVKVSDYGDQIFSVLGRAGNLWETGNRPVPFFDRFYLGGPNNMRGFGFREVGPKEEREPVGGNTYAFLSLEHSIRLAEPLRLAVFYDGGFVNAGTGDFDPGDYHDNYGIGLRIMVMGAPLRLDYGIPIHKSKDLSDGGQFYFSFGTRF